MQKLHDKESLEETTVTDQNAEGNPVVVFGGTGHLGRYVVKSLRKKGVPVRVVSRNAAQARSILGEEKQVAIVEGDITERDTVVQALKHARAIIISVSAFSPSQIRKLKEIERDAVLRLLDETEKAGIERVVYVSTYETRLDAIQELHLDMPIAHIRLEVEQALAATASLNWTILGVAPSMEIYFAMLRGNTMMVPGGGPPSLPSISPIDVGEIAAQVVLRDDLKARRFRMTGPEALSFPEAAARISKATGKEIRFRKIPLGPLRFASILARPFNLYLFYLVETIRLMNEFPQDLADAVPEDHGRLLSTFDYVPSTLEEEVQRLM